MSNSATQQPPGDPTEKERSPIWKEMRKLVRKLNEISKFKKQMDAAQLQPDQISAIEKEHEVREKLRTLREQHPEEAAKFDADMSASQTAALLPTSMAAAPALTFEFFYIVPALTTLTVTRVQGNSLCFAPDPAFDQIVQGAHVVLKNYSDERSFFVHSVNIKNKSIQVSASPVSGAFVFTPLQAKQLLNTTATFAVHPSPYQCTKSDTDFEADIKKFIAALKPEWKPECKMFLQHLHLSSNLSGRPCFRGLLRVQVPSGSKPQALQRLLQDLRGAGHVLVYPAHQFAVQALMGISSRQTLDLNSDACGKAFMDLLIEELWQPFDSLEYFFKKTAFSLIRNLSAHATEAVSANKKQSLLNAARDWCFTGTELRNLAKAQQSSSFWAMSDVLSYVFTATPLAFLLPLCYKAVCDQRRLLKQEVGVTISRISGTGITIDKWPVGFDDNDFVVKVDKDCGPLKKGIAYHVVPSAQAKNREQFGLALYAKGPPIDLTGSVPSLPRFIFQKRADHLQEEAILGFLPSTQPAREVPSLLDSYFNYHKSLPELMSQLEAGLTDDQLFPKVPGNIQKHQYSDPRQQPPSSAFCQRFAVLRAVFNTKLSLLFDRHRVKLGGQPDVFRVSLWCNEETGGVYPFSIDSSASAQVPAQEPKVWLGLSHVVKFPDLCVRIPRAIKTKVHRPDELRALGEVDGGEGRNSGSNLPARTPADDFPKLMDTLKTGSNIASATIHCCQLMQKGEEHYDTASLGLSDVVDSRHESLRSSPPVWISEAGICTLEELFHDGVCIEERRTLAFRNLLRQIFLDMALAVSQLHDCEIIHRGISASFFKIFPIYESPTQRLRVKLVGLSKMTTTSNFQSDVQQLGETMEYLASQLPSATKLDLETYDPSLHFLLKWMQNKEDPPTMHEVLRHPFFMTPAERLTFGIALGGGSKLGMIGSYLCEAPHMAKADCIDLALFNAVNVDFTKHLNSQLNLMFEGTTSEALAAAGAGVRGVAGGGGVISTAAAEAKATLEPISTSDAARADKAAAEAKAAREPIAAAESKTADEVRQVQEDLIGFTVLTKVKHPCLPHPPRTSAP